MWFAFPVYIFRLRCFNEKMQREGELSLETDKDQQGSYTPPCEMKAGTAVRVWPLPVKIMMESRRKTDASIGPAQPLRDQFRQLGAC